MQKDSVTEAQSKVLDRLVRVWSGAAVPTVVHLSSPEYRGKTHIAQLLYERLSGEALVGEASRPPWRTSDVDWRTSRQLVAAKTGAQAGRPWLWVGNRIVPSVGIDLLAPLRTELRAILERRPGFELLQETFLRNVSPSPEDWLGLLGKVTVKSTLETIPFAGAAQLALEGIREGARIRKQRGVAPDMAMSAVGQNFARDLLALLASLRLAHVPTAHTAALPGMILVIDEAQHLGDADLELLDQLLCASPDELLTEQLFPKAVARHLRRLGMPPAFNLLILLLETTSAASDAAIGPFETKIERSDENPLSPVRRWIDEWSSDRTAVDIVRLPNQLPLFSEEEAHAVLVSRFPQLSADVRRVLTARSFDALLGGYHAGLLLSHGSRVALLSDPDEVVTGEWAETHLPAHLSLVVELRAQGLSQRSRRALVAASLLGQGFAAGSVEALLGTNVEQELVEARAASLIHRQADEPSILYVFDDSMAYRYFEHLAVADTTLAQTYLLGDGIRKAEYFLQAATPMLGPASRKQSELARGCLWQFRDLAERADLRDAAKTRSDIWRAALALTGDRDMLLSSMGDKGASERLEQLWEPQEYVADDGQSRPAVCIPAKWQVHRLTPGHMTPSAILNMVDRGGDASEATRCMPAAHRRAAETVSRALKPNERLLGYFEVQLLARLGPYCRLLDDATKKTLATELTYVARWSPTALHLLCSEYWDECSAETRDLLVELLLAYSTVDAKEVCVRSAALLVLRAPGVAPASVVETLVRAFETRYAENVFRDFDVNGAMVDGSAPSVYPWYGLAMFVIAAVSELDPQPVGRSALRNALVRQIGTHPSAVCLLERDFRGDLSKSQRKKVGKARRSWSSSHLIGHFEQGPVPVLDISNSEPRTAR